MTEHVSGPWSYREIGSVEVLTVYDEETETFHDFDSFGPGVVDLLTTEPLPKRILVSYDANTPGHASAAGEIP